jgi:hypothetical protein
MCMVVYNFKYILCMFWCVWMFLNWAEKRSSYSSSSSTSIILCCKFVLMFRSFKSELVSQFWVCPRSCILRLCKYASANFGTLFFFVYLLFWSQVWACPHFAAVLLFSSFGRFRLHCTFTPRNNVRKFTSETSIICLGFLLLVSSNYFSKT